MKFATMKSRRNPNLLVALTAGVVFLVPVVPAYAIPEQIPSTTSASGPGNNFTSEDVAPLVRVNLEATQWQINGVSTPTSTEATGQSKVGYADGAGVVVAVLSDGVDDLHPDLVGAVVGGWDATTGKAIIGGKLHGFGAAGSNGTFQATVIAGSSDGKGLRGIAPKASIMPIVVDGSGNLADRQVAEGINWAVLHGAKILTLSAGIAESVTSDKAKLTCDAIAAARTAGALTFVPAVNDESLSEPTFKPASCDKAVVVSAVGENLSNKMNRGFSVTPDFAAPGYRIVGGVRGDQNLPYTITSSTLWAPVTAAGAAAFVWSQKPELGAEDLVELLSSTATLVGEVGIYGAGVVDVTAALTGSTRRSLEMRKAEMAKFSVPVIVDANRDGAGRTSITWEPPHGITVTSYEVSVHRWSTKQTSWVTTTKYFAAGTVRAVVDAELNDSTYATVTANTGASLRVSAPVNSTWYNPVAPSYQLDDEEAGVTSATVQWVGDGVAVTVVTNDPTRPWDAMIIDPETGEPIKRAQGSAGTTRRVLSVGKFDELRNRPLLIAAGMGRNGVDLLLLPQYGLGVSVLPAGKTRAGVYGQVNCVTDKVFNCDSRGLEEGTLVKVLDAKTSRVLATARVRSDNSFSALWSQKSSSYDIIVVAGAEKSMRRTGKFLLR